VEEEEEDGGGGGGVNSYEKPASVTKLTASIQILTQFVFR